MSEAIPFPIGSLRFPRVVGVLNVPQSYGQYWRCRVVETEPNTYVLEEDRGHDAMRNCRWEKIDLDREGFSIARALLQHYGAARATILDSAEAQP